jgi:acetyl esterase/lipase
MMWELTLSDVAADCETAICHALDNVKGIDPGNLFVMGDSAGGHLAALMAAKINSGHFSKNIKIKGAAIFYGLLDMNDMINGEAWLFKFLTEYFRREVGESYKEYLTELSPYHYFDKNFPPSFLASGKVDPLHPATMNFIDIINENAIKNVPFILEKDRKDGRHAFLNMTWTKSSKESIEAMLKFFEDRVKVKS